MITKSQRPKVCFYKPNDIPFCFPGSDEEIAGFVRLPERECTVSDKDIISMIVKAAIDECGETYFPITGDILVFRMPDEERVYRFLNEEYLVTEKAFQNIDDPEKVSSSEIVHIDLYSNESGDNYEILQ